jgi:plasmid stabilization system protein ParE
MISFDVLSTGPIVSVLAANLLGLSLTANAALADTPYRGRRRRSVRNRLRLHPSSPARPRRRRGSR